MTVTPDLPDWWDNAATTSPHPPPTNVHAVSLVEHNATAELIPLPPAGQALRIWHIAASVLATAGTGGHITIPLSAEVVACQAGQSLDIDFGPSGILVVGSNVVVNTGGTILYTVTAVYDVTI